MLTYNYDSNFIISDANADSLGSTQEEMGDLALQSSAIIFMLLQHVWQTM